MQWRKLGLVFSPHQHGDWMVSHAANPVADHLEGNRFRVYFGCRDRQNRTHIGFVDLALTGDRADVQQVAAAPVLAPGKAGLFDDSGTSLGCLVRDGQRRWLYYLGWNLAVTVPWRNTIGLAISEGPGQPFVKVSRAPILDRSDEDPYSLSYPWVLREGPLWRMWYGSNLEWGPKQEDMRHVIKYAESSDGTSWRRSGAVALGLEEGEIAVSRPCVRRENDGYRVWFSHRGTAYRIGHAESSDGLTFRRRPEPVGIGVSASGWDSEEVAYASVFEHGGRLYMLYNGNGYGRDGFGLAVADSPSGS
jgi:hypothetical protein